MKDNNIIPENVPFTFSELTDAWNEFRYNPGRKITQELLDFEEHLGSNLWGLYDELVGKTWKPGTSILFCVTKPKLREVYAAKLRDRVVHHLYCRRFRKIFEDFQEPCSFACRPGGGPQKAFESFRMGASVITKGWSEVGWILKADLQGFFMSIPRKKLLEVVTGVIETWNPVDPWLSYWLWLTEVLVMHDPSQDCEYHGDPGLYEMLDPSKKLTGTPEGHGIPIGNLTSQIFASLYMSIFDKWALDVLPEESYTRYVDDFVVVGLDPKRLKWFWRESRVFLRDTLGLKLHPKKVSLQRTTGAGTEFVGKRLLHGGRVYPGKNIMRSLWGSFEELSEDPEHGNLGSLNSVLGCFLGTQSYGLRWNEFLKIPWNRCNLEPTHGLQKLKNKDIHNGNNLN